MESATVTGTTDGETIKSIMSGWYKSWTAVYEKPEGAADDYLLPLPGFIHLQDARWLYSDGKVISGNTGVLWRGKLSAVDGFCFGQTGRT